MTLKVVRLLGIGASLDGKATGLRVDPFVC